MHEELKNPDEGSREFRDAIAAIRRLSEYVHADPDACDELLDAAFEACAQLGVFVVSYPPIMEGWGESRNYFPSIGVCDEDSLPNELAYLARSAAQHFSTPKRTRRTGKKEVFNDPAQRLNALARQYFWTRIRGEYFGDVQNYSHSPAPGLLAPRVKSNYSLPQTPGDWAKEFVGFMMRNRDMYGVRPKLSEGASKKFVGFVTRNRDMPGIGDRPFVGTFFHSLIVNYRNKTPAKKRPVKSDEAALRQIVGEYFRTLLKSGRVPENNR